MSKSHIRVTKAGDKLTEGEVYEVYGVTILSRFIFNDDCEPVWLHEVTNYVWED